MIRQLRSKALGLLRDLKHRVQPPDTGYMDWRPLLERDRDLWRDALASRTGPHVLIGTTLGRFKWEVNFDSTLAIALTLRGAHVHLLVCDRQLPACSPWVRQLMPEAFAPDQDSPQATLCDGCIEPSLDVLGPLGVAMHRYSELVPAARVAEIEAETAGWDLARIRGFQLDGVAVGEHAVAGAIRFFACARLEDEPDHAPVLRRYLRAAIMTTLATRELMTRFPFAVTSGSHGIYVPQGLVSEVARRSNVRVVNWHQAYRKKCVLFSHGDTYHKTLLDEPVSEWRSMRWDDAAERRIMDYLESRTEGKQDWIAFNRNPEENSVAAAEKLGVDFTKPVIGLLTNVAWDAQLHYGATPFGSMMDWLIDTIRYFEKRPELQLLVRIHPAEVSGYIRSRQPALAEIKRALPTPPSNVFVIPPESKISTYDTMQRCNAVIIYATKTGIELTARGIPVLVAGEAWIKNKGFALDASSRDGYFALLDQLPLPSRLSADKMVLARQYAYHFFLRRMIPVPYLDDKMRPQIERLTELERGRDRGMDVVCDGILANKSFVYD
jgi:hypothetical protein